MMYNTDKLYSCKQYIIMTRITTMYVYYNVMYIIQIIYTVF